jgi:tetratricopeptide (TPR) repeat protein
VPGAYLYQLFVRKWPQLREVNPYFASGRIAEAIPKLVEILDLDPECPLTCFQLGFCFRATGELEKSESFYLKAMRLAPEAGWIYTNLGRTYQAQGEKKKAAEAFWKALELMPGDHFAVEQLTALGELFVFNAAEKDGTSSVVFVKREEYEKKMEEVFQREKKPEALAGLGWKLIEDRLFELARRCFEKVTETDSESRPAGALLGLGTALLELGRLQDAERALTAFLEDDPGSAAAHLNLFKVYLAQDEMDLAWDEIQTAAWLEPDRMDSLRQLYHLFREADRREEGLEWMEKLAEENPGSFAPLLIWAQALAEGEDWGAAEEALREALRRSPGNEETLLFYSSELGRRGRPEEAFRLLAGGADSHPLSLTLNLALAAAQAGQASEGRLYLEKFKERPRTSSGDKAKIESILKEWREEKGP